RVLQIHNEMRIHTWDDRFCCLGTNMAEVFLYRDNAGVAVPPTIQAGDYLLLEEVRSPVTGLEADANAKHRQMLLIGSVDATFDAAFTNAVAGGVLTPRLNTADPALPLLRVVFAKGQTLSFPACISAETDDHRVIDPVTVARGNIAPADHGRSIVRDTEDGTLAMPDMGSGRWPIPALQLPPADAPVTQRPHPDGPPVSLSINFPGE